MRDAQRALLYGALGFIALMIAAGGSLLWIGLMVAAGAAIFWIWREAQTLVGRPGTMCLKRRDPGRRPARTQGAGFAGWQSQTRGRRWRCLALGCDASEGPLVTK